MQLRLCAGLSRLQAPGCVQAPGFVAPIRLLFFFTPVVYFYNQAGVVFDIFSQPLSSIPPIASGSMYKSFPSFLVPWFNRRRSAHDKPLRAEDVPTSFTMPAQKQDGAGVKLLNVSMNDLEDAFVDISCRQLLYAEAAQMGVERPGTIAVLPEAKTGPATSKGPRKVRSEHDEPDLGQSVVFAEKLKSDAPYRNKNKHKKRRK